MARKLMLACVLLVVCGNATAEGAKQKGGYIGGAYGESSFDDDGAFAGFVFDDEDNAYQIHGGYKFMKYLAIEVRYVDFGTFTLGDIITPDAVDLDTTAVSVHAVGIIPFGESGWELFGQLGLGVVTYDVTNILGAAEDGEEAAFAGGLGVRFSPSPKFSLAIQTDVYVWEDTSLGPVYDLAVGSTQLSIQYIF